MPCLMEVYRELVVTQCEDYIVVAELQYLIGKHNGPFGKDPELGNALKATKGALFKLKTTMEQLKPSVSDLVKAYDAVTRETGNLAYLMHERTTG